jgi:cytochrome c-type biogenesis protein CcsB
MYTTFEIFLANLSFIILLISMLVYWFDASSNYSNSESLEVNLSTSNNNSIVNTNLLISSNPFQWFKRYFNLKTLGSVGMLTSNLSLFILLLLRWNESGHFPLSNLFESLMFLSWSLTLIHLVITYDGDFNFSSFSFISSKQKKKKLINKLIGSITAPCALFTNSFATFSLPKEMQESSPLVPALQSNWLMMHVTVMILSYAALILGSLLSIGFLVISNGVETNNRLTLAKTLDNLSYRILGLGFPLLTIGILSGAVWANEAWGSYWSWDPKETWALLTWLVFAIYLHTRLTKGWEGKKPALIASLGFVTVWICFLGVNLIGEGLHSYGWLS